MTSEYLLLFGFAGLTVGLSMVLIGMIRNVKGRDDSRQRKSQLDSDQIMAQSSVAATSAHPSQKSYPNGVASRHPPVESLSEETLRQVSSHINEVGQVAILTSPAPIATYAQVAPPEPVASQAPVALPASHLAPEAEELSQPASWSASVETLVSPLSDDLEVPQQRVSEPRKGVFIAVLAMVVFSGLVGYELKTRSRGRQLYQA